MSGLEIAAAALAAGYLLLLAVKALLALRYAARYPRSEPSRGEGVAIAQAILSGDPLLEGRLRANAEQLSAAHFLWLVDTDDPEGVRVARRLEGELAAARSAPIRVLEVEPAPPGVNPKLWKLERARVAFAEPVLVVLDDDTLLPPASLGALVAGLARATVYDRAAALPRGRPLAVAPALPIRRQQRRRPPTSRSAISCRRSRSTA